MRRHEERGGGGHGGGECSITDNVSPINHYVPIVDLPGINSFNARPRRCSLLISPPETAVLRRGSRFNLYPGRPCGKPGFMLVGRLHDKCEAGADATIVHDLFGFLLFSLSRFALQPCSLLSLD